MLFIDHVRFGYDDEPVLDGCCLKLQPGEIHGILGPNGSGKTTLLHILAGQLSPDSGKVNWSETSLTHQHIAFLEAQPHFYPMITGREYLNLFVSQNPDFDTNGWNELFDLPLDQLIETYSNGMKKKLAFMSIIALDRPIILLDEPFNNLDVNANQLISNILKLLGAKGKIILLTSHILEILTAMTDFIHLLQEGKITRTVPNHQFDSWEKTYRLEEINVQIDKANALL